MDKKQLINKYTDNVPYLHNHDPILKVRHRLKMESHWRPLLVVIFYLKRETLGGFCLDFARTTFYPVTIRSQSAP